MKKILRFLVMFVLIIGVCFTGLYFSSQDDYIYEGVYIGHPVFTEGVAAPSHYYANKAACDGERIYMLHSHNGTMVIYGIDGQLLGTYAFYNDSNNGSFSVFCDEGITYVFDKGGDVYQLDALEMTKYTKETPEIRALQTRLERRGDEYICRYDSQGVWLRSEDGEVLALAMPTVHPKAVPVCASLVIIAFILYFKLKNCENEP